MNVLIVEDSTSARKLLRITLEHYRCSVVEAQDGQEGLEQALLHKPDIIISDALMPRMDGFQLLRALKADPGLRNIPFVFYSSTYTGDKEAELALSMGADAFVAKPAEPEELWSRTCQVMQSWEARQRVSATPALSENHEEYLREYSKVVAAKLEEKVHELQEALESKTRAENALQEQEQELATIFENAPFIMLLVDGERRLRRVNDCARTFTGLAAAEMIGRRSGDVLHCLSAIESSDGCGSGPDCEGCTIRTSVADSFETGRSHHLVERTLMIRKKGDHSVTFLVSTNRVTVKNQPMVLLSIQDITEYRKLEGQLRQAQKMESIGTLAGGIAHDFNNILTVIIGYGQVTLMGMPEGEPQRHNIEQILAAAERASHLTKDLLLFSRKQNTERKNADLNQIIRLVEKFLVRIIGEDITCTTTLAEGLLPVCADAHQIEQVLVNLATNARDAMPGGGMFAVATERVMLDGSFAEVHGYGRPGLYGVISVTDTGCGMDEITRQHIFDPFFTTKEVGKGTGLGMAVVYGIIKQHEGYINVYSEPGRGATFRIYLPIIAPGQEADPPKQEVERSLSGKETILLAEDDETVRTITISILQSFGYRVIVAADGEEAVERFQETRDRIDLLLFDLVMPKKTGQEAYEEIARSAPGVKVIFTTGYAPEMVKQREQMDSRVVYAWKPFSPTELLTKVRNVLDARPEAATGSDSGTV